MTPRPVATPTNRISVVGVVWWRVSFSHGWPRCLLQTAAIWAALYLTSLTLCRGLIANDWGMVALLVSTLPLVAALLMSRAVDVFVVIAYLPALLVLLALWIRGTTDPVS
jgi:hypothetical protein